MARCDDALFKVISMNENMQLSLNHWQSHLWISQLMNLILFHVGCDTLFQDRVN
jgi:hypothetical protein